MNTRFVVKYIVIFLITLAFIYSLLILGKKLNSFAISVVISLGIILLLTLFNIRTTLIENPTPSQNTAIRYTMLCKNCNWEWMSHTTDKSPQRCPNCNEKAKLEVLGWRKVSMPKKIKHYDLRKFFK